MTRNLLGLLILSSILLLVSWSYLIVASDDQFGDLELTSGSLDENGTIIPGAPLFPKAVSGMALQGQQVYLSLGCVNCHTQQVRLEGIGRDLERGWGFRPSMPRDYVRLAQPLLGRFRHGPDLSNAGTRSELTEKSLHRHLYSPQADFPDSICQPNPFLFDRKDIDGDVSANGLSLGDGTEIIPNKDARKLVAYLKSLRQDYELPEMPFVVEPPMALAPVTPQNEGDASPENNQTSDE